MAAVDDEPTASSGLTLSGGRREHLPVRRRSGLRREPGSVLAAIPGSSRTRATLRRGALRWTALRMCLRNIRPTRGLLLGAAAAAMLLLGRSAAAHPLGNFTINHYARLELGRKDVRVRYVVD